MGIIDKIIKKTEEIANSEQVQKIKEQVESTTENLIDKSKEFVEDIQENETLQNAISSSKEAIKDFVEDVKESPITGKVVETTSNLADSAGKTLHDLGDKAMDNQFVKNSVDSVKDMTQKAMDSQIVQDVVEKSKDVANDITEGVQKMMNKKDKE